MEVLLTQRDTLEARLELIETKKDQMSAMIDLYRSLGGGWKETEVKTDPTKDNLNLEKDTGLRGAKTEAPVIERKDLNIIEIKPKG